MRNEKVKFLSTNSLIGTDIVNGRGEHLGDLEEIMLDLDSGSVAYAVLSFGGILGLGDKLFALPWQALEVDQESEEIILDVDKQLLENAPGFDKDNWPQMADTAWLGEVYNYYGYSYS